LVSCWLVTHASSQSWLITAVFMVLGTLFYWLAARPRSEINGD